jgi:ribosomal protein L4
MPRAPKLGGGDVALDDAVFAAKFNGPLVHEVVRAELNALRQGTAATKTRGNVRGGGAKPWRQKGTGRARAGSSRSPVWKGGGTVFGPSPRHYTFKVNRKARRAALRSALSVHADRGSIAVFDATGFDAAGRSAAERLGPAARDARAARRRRGDRGPVVPQHVARDRDAGRGRGRRRRHRRRFAADLGERARAAHRACQRRDPRHGGGRLAMDASQVIIRPVVSEKSFVQAEIGKYTFRVHSDAHKTQIRQAVEQLFEVKVRDVRTVSVKSKPKRRGIYAGRTRTWKKAIVQLAPGDTIPIFQGLEGTE